MNFGKEEFDMTTADKFKTVVSQTESAAAVVDPTEVKVGRRFQVVIPPAVRKKMRLKEGDKLLLSLDAKGTMRAEKLVSLPVSQLVANHPALETEILKALKSLANSEFLKDDEFDALLED